MASAAAAPTAPLARRQILVAEASVVVCALLVVAVLAQSPNSPGHKLKAVLLLAGGSILFLLGVLKARRPTVAGASAAASVFEGLVYFAAFGAAAVLTLTLDFAGPVQRSVGVGAQIAAGVLGLVGCARHIRAS